MALAMARQALTDERMASLALPEGGIWISAARARARDRLREMGLPERRDEYWKFTRPDSFLQAEAPRAALLEGSESADVFGALDRLRIVFVDGVFDAGLSDDLALEGVKIDFLSDAALRDIHWSKDIYGRSEERGQNPVSRPFAALNSAFAMEGALIHVTGSPARAINLVYIRRSETSDVMLHHIIKLDRGARLTLLENGTAGARLNQVMEVDMGEGAVLDHVRTQGPDHARRALTHIFATLGKESTFRSFTMIAGGVLTRNECVIELSGDDASAHVAGAALGDGDFHQDDTVFITHDALRCESRQVFKKVLRNGATGVFQGKILVKPGAQKTDGYQISQSLLLDEDSQFLAKPELEIYADDVACSHGSTTGAIDEDTLYYLRARGIPKALATDLLTLAFLAEPIEEIEDEGIREVITSRLDRWLDRGQG